MLCFRAPLLRRSRRGTTAALAASAAVVALGLVAAPAARAQFVGQNFQTIDPPFASKTPFFGGSEAYGISNNGIIAGDYTAADDVTYYGYLYQNGNFTSVQYPAQNGTTGNYTILNSANSSGASVGRYYAFDAQGNLVSETNFLRSSTGDFTTLTYPGATTNLLQSINDAGIIAGQYYDANNLNHGFTYDTNTKAYAAVPDVPGTSMGNTFLQQVSNTGVLVGSTNTVDLGPTSGFLYRNGKYETFNVPGAVSTFFNGINAAGIVSGRYLDSNNLSHGFLYNSNNGSDFFSTFDFPGATETLLRTASINDSNQIAGTYADANGTYHSFTAQAVGAPEPSALALLTMGASLAGSTVFVRRRRRSKTA